MNKLTRALGYFSFSSLSLLASFNTAHAASFLGNHDANYYVGVTMGLMSVASRGTTTTQITQDYGADTWAGSGSKSGMMFGLVGGVNLPRATTSSWFNAFQLEASIWQLNGTNVTGVHTIPLTDPWRYNYQYKLQLQTLSLDGAVNLVDWHRLIPFVGFGLDLARANTNHYQETPIGDADSSDLAFATQTKSLFLYHARVGVRYQLPKHWQAQVAYTYYPSVKITTGSGNTGVITIPGISNNVTLSNIGLTLSYLF